MPRVIGLMSGSSLDGLDIACVDFSVDQSSPSPTWTYRIVRAETVPYSSEWATRLATATQLDARSYLLLHTSYGHHLGQCVKDFLARHGLEPDEIDLVASHGHTVFHEPWNQMTGQIGDGAAISAQTGLVVVSDLRALDVAHGGQGAPIVPIGEKYLLASYRLLLNIGGIANISDQKYAFAFDICPANQVLNRLVQQHLHKEYDDGGQFASAGTINEALLDQLNRLDYYGKVYPKSLANAYSLDAVQPLLESANLTCNDLLRTYVEHIVQQVSDAIQMMIDNEKQAPSAYANCKLLVTGGGAHNTFLMQRLQSRLKDTFGVDVECPARELIDFKEALVMAFIGLLRVSGKPNVLSSVTGARKDTVGGAVWSN